MSGASVVVLAGGQSRRLRRDKRMVPVEGVPLLRRAVTAALAVSHDVIVVDSRGAPLPARLVADLPVRVVRDIRSAAGPLAGLEAGLLAAREPIVIAVAGDAPFLRPELLEHLATRLADAPDADAAAIVSERGPEPLLAAYRRELLRLVTRSLDAGERRLASLLGKVRLRSIPATEWRRVDPQGRSLENINVPADLDR